MKPPKRVEASTHLTSLTSLRFFAAFHVVVFHMHDVGLLPNLPLVLRKFVENGYVAVSMFFVLSGFILTYNYLGRAKEGTLEKRSFWRARFARVYPVHALGLLLALPFFLSNTLAVHTGAELIRSLAANIILSPLLLQAWITPLALEWNPPSWSLSVEALFYFLFPWLIAVIARMTMRQAVVLSVGLGLLSTLFSGIYGAIEMRTGTFPSFARFFPLVHLPQFIVGIVLCRVFLERRSKGSSSTVHSVITAASLAVIVVAFLLRPPIPFILLHNSLLLLPFCTLVYALAAGGLRRPLEWRPLVLLGEASYSLYILHIPLLLGTVAVADRLHVPRGPALEAAFILISLVASIVVYRFFEMPMRERLRGPRSRGEVAATPP